MAITLDGHEINTLVLKASNGGTVTKQLLEVGGVSVDRFDIYNKELVETWGGTYNLGSDTNFDSLNRDGNKEYITISGLAAKEIPLDIATYCGVLMTEIFIKAAYSSTPGEYAMDSHSAVYYVYYFNGGSSSTAGTVLANVRKTKMYVSGSPTQRDSGSSYGVYSEYINVGTLERNSSKVVIPQPKFAIRSTATYAPAATLQAINSAQSTITFRSRFYKIPIESFLNSLTREVVYINDNDGLRPLT